MALVINVGVNSLSTIQEANDYLLGSARAHGTWDFAAANDNEVTRLLVSSQRLLNVQNYRGTKTGGGAQILPFPRDGLKDREGNDLPDNTIPSEMLDAQAEWALLIKLDEDAEAQVEQGQNIKKVSAGEGVGVTFFMSTTGTLERIPANIYEMISPYVFSSTQAVGAMATGVDDATTIFCDPFLVNRP